MKTFAPNDTHGRLTLDGMYGLITQKKERQIKSDRTYWFPKSRNSYSDPYTYYHVTDMLLQLWPNEMVRTREFTEAMADRPLLFDPITVGRVVKDIQESLEIKNGRSPIQSGRWWDGTRFWVSRETEDRVALEHLLEDLRLLCGQPTDGMSPLRRCASLM